MSLYVLALLCVVRLVRNPIHCSFIPAHRILSGAWLLEPNEFESCIFIFQQPSRFNWTEAFPCSFLGIPKTKTFRPGSVERGKSPSHQVQGQGLGIMIIEGKHAEVGQGIFISDIQEGSAAYQAGLSVGDMILAVNKDSLVGSNYDAAAALLKKTEGVVTLVVCNPNRAKEEEKLATAPTTPVAGVSTPAAQTPAKTSIAGTPKLAPPPGSLSPSPSGKLKVEDDNLALTAVIVPGVETTIEINKEKIGLGLSIVGGTDTLLGAIVVHELYDDGAAAKDGRLMPGDQIIECNGEDFRNVTNGKALTILRQTPAKVRMVILRDDGGADPPKADLDIMEVEIAKKPGKGLGLSVVGMCNGEGVYISDIVPGGAASTDGRMMRGD
ncbi:hypothetical protein GE061_000800, partial [Apolygus lucorum]